MCLLVYLLFMLHLCFVNTESVCDKFNKTSGEQTRRNFEINYCLENYWCTTDLNFSELNRSDLLIIEKADYLTTCFISKLPNLRNIHGANLNISFIELRAFEDLPRLEKIDLSFNFIKVIKFGAFNELPLHELNLSWNEINFIGEATFYLTPNLKKLDLSRNYLTNFDGRYFFSWDKGTFNNPTSKENLLLEHLALSHNNIQTVQHLGDFPNLKLLDLSHNKIFQISEDALEIRAKVDILDLTDNYLTSLSFKKTNIKELRVALNNLKHINSAVESVRSIAIFGNPFRCTDYDAVLSTLQQQKITLIDRSLDIYFLTNAEKETYPNCLAANDYFTYNYFAALNKYESIKQNYIDKKYPSCNSNNDCPEYKLCKTGQCWDPCREDVCHTAETCKVVSHKFQCSCPENYSRNAYIMSSPCVPK